jgi:hypothetical protein
MLISLSIGLVNVDDISLVKQVGSEHRLFWRSSGDDYSIISQSDCVTLHEVANLQYGALVKAATEGCQGG